MTTTPKRDTVPDNELDGHEPTLQWLLKESIDAGQGGGKQRRTPRRGGEPMNPATLQHGGRANYPRGKNRADE